MPGKWNSLEFETGALQGTLESASAVLESIVTLLKAVRAVVQAAEAFIETFESATKALLNAIISIIEQTILNILETNAHVGFYSNLQYDTEWSWKPKAGVEPPNPNWENGDYPIDGTGMSGWLTTMTASTFDTSNPFRPITDSGTAVSGMILVVGAPSFSELGEFKQLFAELLNFDDFKLKTQEEIEALGYSSRWKMIGGYFGSRLSELSDDLDEVKTTYDEIKNAIDEQANDPVPDADEVFLNSPGPTWVGIPIASLLGEPVRQTATAFRKLINSFTFADTPLTQLINAILKKIDQITELVQLINRLIESLIALLNFLETISFYYAAEDGGGTKRFFRNAATAENVPNYGVNGVVIGGAALTTHPTDVFESMISLFGANAQAAFSAVSTGAESFSATLDNVEDAAAEVEWQE